MYGNILAALDGSPRAESVLPHVESLARAFKSRVTLLRVTTPPGAVVVQAAHPVALPVHPAGIVDPTPIVEAERQEAGAYLDSQAAALRGRGLEVSTRLEAGAAADVILDVARRDGVELIALTTHGRGGVGRLLFGSVAETVLRSSPCPVLLIRVAEPAE